MIADALMINERADSERLARLVYIRHTLSPKSPVISLELVANSAVVFTRPPFRDELTQLRVIPLIN